MSTTPTLGLTQTTPRGIAERVAAHAAGVAAIEQLRTEERSATERWTLAQMRTLVQGPPNGWTPEAIAEATGWDVTTVKDIIGDFGTRIRKRVGGAPVVTASADEAGMLFPIEEDTQKLLKRAKRSKREGAEEAVFNAPVVLPRGFERGAEDRRDVRKAISAIIVAHRRGLLTDELLTGYLDRKQPVRVVELGFAHVAVVWRHAVDGKLATIIEVSEDHAFRQVIVQAYDLLEVARLDALSGVETLVAGNTSDLDALRRACAKARWVATAEINRIEDLVARVAQRPANVGALERELRYFAQRVRALRGYVPATIADLNEGQVLRIAELAGLPTDVDRTDERIVRKRLVELGFTSDLDQLTPQGVRSIQAGVGDAFWEAMTARANKFEGWRDILQDALAAIGEAAPEE